MTGTARQGAALAVLGLSLTAVAVTTVASSPHVEGAWPLVVVAVSVLLPIAAAALVQSRFPGRSLAGLLVAVGVAYCIRALAASDNSVIYSVARGLGQIGEVLLLWLMLAFPSGRLSPRARWVVGAGVVTIVGLWWPVILLSDVIPAAGPFVPCSPDCPDNALQISHEQGVADVFTTAFRYSGAALLLSAAWILGWRLVRATPLTRRMLGPLLGASVARVVAVAAFLALGSPGWVRGFLVLTYWAIPVAIIVGLMRGRGYDAAALERLVTGLRSRPGPEQLRNVMAEALADRSLDIVYWIPDAGSYADADGQPVTLPAAESGRAVTVVSTQTGEPTAALLHDPALLDHPGLLDATTASTAIALESNRLEAEVAAARAGTITAVDAERRRIERDLHDGAQQRLVALRMKLAVAERLIGQDGARARTLLAETGGDIDAALEDVRALAHGALPAALVEGGLAAALPAAAQAASLPVSVAAAGVPRLSVDVETAVYFCCLEAMQNAAKHAGTDTSARVTLEHAGDELRFTVADDGPGFDAAEVAAGSGLMNMRERLTAVGGTLTIESRRGTGTEITGRVPAGPRSMGENSAP